MYSRGQHAAAAEPLRKLLEEVIHRSGLLLQALAQPPAGERNTRRLDRLQQVVDGAVIEGADRVLIIGSDENEVSLAGERLGGLDAIHLRHVDVEKDDIGLEAVHYRDCLAAVAGFAHDHELGPRFLETAGDLLAHEALVVDDHGSRSGRGTHATLVNQAVTGATS